jgi:hypothetical protein
MKTPEIIKIKLLYKRDDSIGTGNMWAVHYTNRSGHSYVKHYIAFDELGAYKKFMQWARDTYA